MKPYADTNVLTRLYLNLPETPAASALLRASKTTADRIPITWLHRVEFANAVEIHVFLGQQGGHIRVTPEQAALAHGLFADDLRTAQVCVAEAPRTPTVVAGAVGDAWQNRTNAPRTPTAFNRPAQRGGGGE